MRHGFTLIELMVVVVVILILLGIAAGIGAWASRTSEESLTRASLMNAQLILDEYVTIIGGTGGWPAGTGGISTLVANTKNSAAFKRYYGSIPAKQVDLAANRLNDGWGNAIHFVPAGNAYSGNPQRTAPYLMSGGPDGNVATIGDNVYSFAVLR